MGEALEKFFFDTLQRNGKGERADVDVPVSPFGTGRFEESVLSGDYDSYYGWSQYVQQYPNYAMPVTTVPSHFPSPPHQDNILALSTQLNWSEGDFPALSAQQNWSMFYQSGTNVYIPGQTLFHPTYSLGKGGRSRGTGTYIPDLVDFLSYQTLSIYVITHYITLKMVTSCRVIIATGIYMRRQTGQGDFLMQSTMHYSNHLPKVSKRKSFILRQNHLSFQMKTSPLFQTFTRLHRQHKLKSLLR